MESVKVTVCDEQRLDRVQSFLAGAITMCGFVMLHSFVTDYEETCACIYALVCLCVFVFGYLAIALAIAYIIYYGVCAACYCMRAIGKLIWYVTDLLELVGSSIIKCHFQIGMRIGFMRYMYVHVAMLGIVLYYYMH